MFRHLKGRRVIVNLTGGDAVRGEVLQAGWIYLRISSSDEARTFDVIDARAGEGMAAGVARIPFWSVVFIQEL